MTKDVAGNSGWAAGAGRSARSGAMLSPAGWLAIITLIGAVLRFVGVDHQSLWLDEVSSLRNAHVFGESGLNGLATVDQIAPLHSITLWLFTSIGGDTEFAVRLPSVLAGIATTPLTYLAASRMFGLRGAALVAAGLVAISPFGIWYSQEGRMYALLMMAATAYAVVAWPIVERPLRAGELALLTLITAIGLGMHHYMALMMVSFGLFLLIKDRGITGRSWAWGISQIVAALIFSYWMVLTAHTLDNAAGNAKPGFFFWAPYSFYSFVAGLSYGPSIEELAMAGDGVAQAALRHAIPVAILTLATFALMVLAVPALRRRPHRPASLWLLTWLFAPVLLAIVATFVTNVQFNVRYVVMSFPALMILLGLAIAGVPWAALAKQGEGAAASIRTPGALAGAVATLVFGGCLLIATANIYTDPDYAKADVRALGDVVRAKPADAMLVSDNSRITKMLAYYDAPHPERPMQVDYTTERLSPTAVWRHVRGQTPPSVGQIWLIEYRSWESDPSHLLRNQLERNGRLISVQQWPGVTLRRYRPDWTGTPDGDADMVASNL